MARSCFASAYLSANGAVTKLKLGVAAPTRTNGTHAATVERDPNGRLRYVLTIEAPAGLDPTTGLSVSADAAFGILPLSRGCNQTSCTASALIEPNPGALARRTPAGPPGPISIIGTVGPRGYRWQFESAGLNEAFARVISEMEGSAPPIQQVASSAPSQRPPRHRR